MNRSYADSLDGSIPPHQAIGVSPSTSPQEVASLVQMHMLLAHLGFDANERIRRARCVLCGSHNPTAFSWREDGCWHCFRCNAGGDKIALVRAVCQCGFQDAMRVLCGLAGIAGPGEKAWRGPTRKERRRQDRLKEAAEKYLTLESVERLRLADELRRVERLATLSAHYLAHLRAGAREERFTGEQELAWEALALSYRDRLPLLAAYLVVSFSDEDEKQEFVLYPSRRRRLIEDCLWRGGVVTDAGGFVEIAL
jgi:hypothetical protein